MFVSPLDEDDVLTSFSNNVVNGISFTSFVLDNYLLTWSFRSINTDVQNVVPGLTTIYRETIVSVSFSIVYSRSGAFNMGCQRVSKIWNG